MWWCWCSLISTAPSSAPPTSSLSTTSWGLSWKYLQCPHPSKFDGQADVGGGVLHCLLHLPQPDRPSHLVRSPPQGNFHSCCSLFTASCLRSSFMQLGRQSLSQEDSNMSLCWQISPGNYLSEVTSRSLLNKMTKTKTSRSWLTTPARRMRPTWIQRLFHGGQIQQKENSQKIGENLKDWMSQENQEDTLWLLSSIFQIQTTRKEIHNQTWPTLARVRFHRLKHDLGQTYRKCIIKQT